MPKRCPVCEQGELKRKTLRQTFNYKKQKLRYDQPGLYCSACGEAILDNLDMNATEPLLYDFKARVDGYLTTSEIRTIRKRLKLSQKTAGDIFGGGHNAFSRYESGKARPPKSTDSLLRLLEKRPELLKEIPKRLAA